MFASYKVLLIVARCPWSVLRGARVPPLPPGCAPSPRKPTHRGGGVSPARTATRPAFSRDPPPRPRSGTLWLPRFPLFPFGPGPAHLEAGSAAAWERFHQLGPRNAELFNLSIPRCTEAPGCLGPAAFGTATLDKQRRPRPALRPQLQPGLGTAGAGGLHKRLPAWGGGCRGTEASGVCATVCV